MNESELKIKQVVTFHDPPLSFFKNDPRPNLYKTAMSAYSGLECTVTRIIWNKDETPTFIWVGILFDDGTEFNVYPDWLSNSGVQAKSNRLTVDKIKELLYDLERTIGRDKRRNVIDEFVDDFNRNA